MRSIQLNPLSQRLCDFNQNIVLERSINKSNPAVIQNWHLMVVNSNRTSVLQILNLRRGKHLENYLETNAEATLQSPIATNS